MTDPSTDAGTTSIGRAAERRSFGWGVRSAPIDPQLFYARDIQLNRRGDGTLDLALVDGIDTLEQDLRTAIGTGLGSDPLNTRHGFDGAAAIAEEHDFMLLRERLRAACVTMLRADPRVLDVVRVLIGAEIAAFSEGDTAAPPPAGVYGMVDVQATFRIVGGHQVTLAIGPVLAGA